MVLGRGAQLGSRASDLRWEGRQAEGYIDPWIISRMVRRVRGLCVSPLGKAGWRLGGTTVRRRWTCKNAISLKAAGRVLVSCHQQRK